MVSSFLSKFSNFGLLLLRLTTGIAYVFVHGWPKISGGPELWGGIGKALSNFGITFLPGAWGFLAAISEFGGGILLILGLFTRPAAAFMGFTMFVAATYHLTKLDPWNRVIYPVEMLGIFLCLIFVGAGKFSLDYLLFKKK